MILPRKTVLELGKLLADVDEPVTLDILANQVRFRFGNIELVSKVVDGKFPDYNRVIPTGHTKRDRARRGRSSWPRCSARPSCRTRSSAACASCSAAGTLKIICTNSEQEEAEEELEIAYEGDAARHRLQHHLPARRAAEPRRRTSVQLAFGDANSSALVTIPERDDYKYVVMPMRI